MRGFVGILGTGLALAVGSVAIAQSGGSDAELERLCRTTEVAVPDSCACTITAARAANVSDDQMASLFADDGHSNPVDQAAYGRFWLAKADCIAKTTIAGLQMPGGAALTPPSFPANPPPAPTPRTNQPPPSQRTANPAATQSSLPFGVGDNQVVSMSADQARTALDQLRGSQWTGLTLYGPGRPISATLDFRDDGLLVIRYDADPVVNQGVDDFAVVYQMQIDEIDPNRFTGEHYTIGYRNIRVDARGNYQREGGRYATFPIMVTDLRFEGGTKDRLMLDYRGGDELILGSESRHGYHNEVFKRVGRANNALPAGLSDNAKRRIGLAGMTASSAGSMFDRLSAVESRLLGDAACTDDIHLWKTGAPIPIDLEQFFAANSKRIGTGWFGDGSSEQSYEINFDGKSRILARTNRFDAPVLSYSDGDVSMDLTKRGQSADDGAFGFTAYDAVLSQGNTRDAATVLIFGGC